MSASENQGAQLSGREGPAPARDLVEFHLRWKEFRSHAEAIPNSQRLSPIQAETLTWLICLADRIQQDDID